MSRNVGDIADQCQKLVDDTVEGRSAIGEFSGKLRNLGVTASEGKDYVEQLDRRIRQAKRDGKRRETDIGNEETLATSSSQPTLPSQLIQDIRHDSTSEDFYIEQDNDSQ